VLAGICRDTTADVLHCGTKQWQVINVQEEVQAIPSTPGLSHGDLGILPLGEANPRNRTLARIKRP